VSPIGDLVPPGGALFGIQAANKRQLFAQLADHAARVTTFDPADILAALLSREAQGTTGFGGGTAIPHIRLPGLTRIWATVCTLGAPVDYAALDGLPVDLVVMMLAPAAAGADHLKALARISRMLRDRDATAKLRSATSGNALEAMLAVDPHSCAA